MACKLSLADIATDREGNLAEQLDSLVEFIDQRLRALGAESVARLVESDLSWMPDGRAVGEDAGECTLWQPIGELASAQSIAGCNYGRRR